MDTLTLADRVLRHPEPLVSDDPADLAERAPGLLALGIGGLAIFGLAIASWRGGLQYLYAPIKLPFAVLLAVALTLPAMRVLFDVPSGAAGWIRLSLSGLVGLARAGILAAAAVPLLWLPLSVTHDYGTAIFATACVLALAGLPGLATVASTLDPRTSRPFAWILSVGLMGLLVAESSWMLRPFLVRPSAPITFLRTVEDDVFTGLLRASDNERWEEQDRRGGDPW